MRTRNFCYSIFILTVLSAQIVIAQTKTLTFEFSKISTTVDDPRNRAVAFYSLTFLDNLAKPLDTLLFGTSESNNYQGDGWFENEQHQEYGSFQWAGGIDKSADMSITIPNDVEGMLIKIHSVEDSLWLTAKVDDEVVAQFRVDSYLRSSYIPLSSAIPIEKPQTEPVWDEDLYFPQFPVADYTYIIRIPTKMHHRGFSWQDSFRIDHSFEDMMALTLISMQGIINRYKPSVYIEWGLPASIEWREIVQDHVESAYLQIDAMTAINFLNRKFGHWFEGAVIYDPAFGETINLATMYAGLENRMILAPVQVNLPGMPQFDSTLDLRELAEDNEWDLTEEGRLKLYQWVYDNLWPDLDKRILGVITAGPPTSGPVDDSYFPLSLAGRDYLIALKLSALSLDINNPDQYDLLSDFMKDVTPPKPVSGLIGLTENPMLELIVEHGNWMAGMHWPGNTFSSANLTLLSGVSSEIIKYEPELNENRILASLKNMPVATLFTTDGDPFFYSYEFGFRDNISWYDVQDQLLGWSINPVLSNISPMMWNHYVQSRNRAGLISSVSGAGYVFPWLLDDENLEQYLSYTNKYLKITGLKVVHIFEDLTTSFWSEKYGIKYAEALADAGYLGAILGYGHNELRGLGFYYTNSAQPTVRTSYRLNSSTLDAIVDDLSSRKPGEEFYDFNESYFLNPDVQYLNDEDAIGGKAVYIPTDFRNSESYSLINAIGPLSLAPGEYEVSVRVKVAENTSSSPIGSVKLLYDGPNPPEGINDLPILELIPSEFQSANAYEEFKWNFSLDSLITELYYWIDYGDGATDLWLDFVHSQNKDGSSLPVIGTIVVDNINPFDNQLSVTPNEFENKFINRGGIILKPDEYIASLNPEFMLELGKKYLGQNNEVTEAEMLLNEKKYLESLLKIRTALEDIAIPNEQIADDNPSTYNLYQNYPNPFNPSTVIRYQLPAAGNVQLQVFDVLGREVASLVNGWKAAGNYTYNFDAKDLASGIYIYRIKTRDFVATRKMLLIK